MIGRTARALIALATLLALALSAGAGGASAAEPTLGANVQSRVYIDQGGTMDVWNRSTVEAVFTFEPTGGWSVEPAELVLAPDETAVVTVAGQGEDGAGVGVRVQAVEPPPTGAQASELLLTALVFHEAPVDAPDGWLLLGAVAALAAAWALGRLRPWQIRVTRAH